MKPLDFQGMEIKKKKKVKVRAEGAIIGKKIPVPCLYERRIHRSPINANTLLGPMGRGLRRTAG